jgi:aspartyl protease family protein
MCPTIYNWLSDNKNTTPILSEDSNKNKIIKSIQLTKRNGVYYIPVELNNLISTNFVFDTGASDVSISKNLYGKMLELNLLDKNDIIGFANYQIADGTVNKQLIINIKFLQIGGVKIRDVRASVSNTKDAPLLLGQSAISRIGSWKLNHKNNRLEFESSK